MTAQTVSLPTGSRTTSFLAVSRIGCVPSLQAWTMSGASSATRMSRLNRVRHYRGMLAGIRHALMDDLAKVDAVVEDMELN